MSASATAQPSEYGPLSAEHVVQLRSAHRRARKLRAARRYATFSGYTTFACGVITLPFGLGNGALLALGVSLVAVGYHELALRRRLMELTRSAPISLAVNQVILCVVIVAYALWMLLAAVGTGPRPVAAAPELTSLLETEFGGSMPSLPELERTLSIAVYATLIIGTVLFQGMAAAYYRTRKRHLARFLSETPGWIINLHQAGIMR